MRLAKVLSGHQGLIASPSITGLSLVGAIACAILACLAPDACAQYPTHRIDALSPSGGQVGTSLTVQVLGTELEDLTELRFSHPGIVAKQAMSEATEFVPARPINDRFEVAISEDVPPGLYEARVFGRFGLSNARRFEIGRLPGVMEVGGNQKQDNAMELTTNSVVDGRIDANVEDFFRVHLSKDESILIECRTKSIDSRAIVALKLYDQTGREITRHRDPRGQDSVIQYTANSDQDLLIGVRDFLFKGGTSHFYRLVVHDQPYIAYVWPPAVKNGTTTEVEVFGWNLPDGKPHASARLFDQVLESTTWTVDSTQATSEAGTSFVDPHAFANRYVELDLSHDKKRSNRFPVFVSDLNVIDEIETGDATSVQELELPVEIVGHFDPVRDLDRFQFAANKGEVVWIDVRSQQLGSSTDPEILVQRVTTDEQGAIKLTDIAAVDDPANRNGLIGSDFDLTTDDPSYRLQIPEDGQYRVTLKNLFSGRLDPRDVYRLRIQSEPPSFTAVARPVVARPGNANQVIVSSLVLRRGEARKIGVAIQRLSGHNGLIRIEARGLPEGVVCDPLFLPDSLTEGTMRIVAGEQAVASDQLIQLVAIGDIGGQQVELPVQIGTVVWGTNNRTQQRPVFRLTQSLPVSVIEIDTSPILIADALPGDDPQRRETPLGRIYETSRGGKLDLKLDVVRRNEFKAAFNVVQVGLPREFGLNQIAVPENATEVAFAILANNNNLKPGWYQFYVQGDVKWSHQKNPDVIVRAQAEVQRLTELVQQLTTQSEQTTANMKTAEQTLAEANEAVKSADSTLQAAGKELESASTTLTQAQMMRDQANEQLQANTEDEALKQAVATADENVSAAQLLMTEAQAKVTAAEELVSQSKAAVTERDAEFKQAQQAVADMAEKLKVVQGLKTAADQNVNAVNNAYKPYDLTETMVSQAFYVHLVASPIKLEAADAQRIAGETFEIPIQITRDYGFAEAVDVNAQLPNNFSNASPMKLALGADLSTGMLQIVTKENTPPGTYPVTVKATGKFNNVNVETTVTINLEVKPKT